jgi:hypothetical protein
MKSSPYSEQLASALRATEIHNASSWSWFWDRQNLFSPSLRRALGPDTVRAELVFAIRERLYSHFYCRGVAAPVESAPVQAAPASARAMFVAELSAANEGAGYVEEGWEVADRGESVLRIERSGVRLHVAEHEVDAAPPPRGNGASVALRLPKELRFASPGFYLAMGNMALSMDETGPFVRWYWNLRPEGAARLVRAVTTTFNEAQVPFRLKVLDDPDLFTRCDAGVLYTARDDGARVGALLGGVHGELELYLQVGVPALTKPVASGLGVAEDPASGASFGHDRCRVLAEGIVRAFESNGTGLEERSAIVRDCFAEHGISLETPYLNPGSEDAFEVPGTTKPATVRQSRDRTVDPGELLETAAAIGALVVESAVWHRERCNWLGFGPPRDGSAPEGSSPLVYRALGPDLYAGTAGIALFLAELYAATGTEAARRTSLGAIRQAVSATRAQPRTLGAGLHAGALGVAVVAAYVGRLLGDRALPQQAADVVGGFQQQARDDPCADLISGHAGSIVSLLLLSSLLEDPELIELARELGDGLRELADRREHWCSWRSPTFPGQRHLLGLSHGAAGIACALLELYRATDDEEYCAVARSALAYERLWYDAESGNWPDFRGVPADTRGRDVPAALPAFWCHGAAGIALSRLHAHRILGDRSSRVEARIALTTTKVVTERMLSARRTSFSLCHGLAGNADVLATGSRCLGDAFPEGAELATRVATAGIQRYAQSGHGWPFDLLGSSAPSLMLGLSGVGHLYLRLHDPHVPSVLLPDREAMSRRANGAR